MHIFWNLNLNVQNHASEARTPHGRRWINVNNLDAQFSYSRVYTPLSAYNSKLIELISIFFLVVTAETLCHATIPFEFSPLIWQLEWNCAICLREERVTQTKKITIRRVNTILGALGALEAQSRNGICINLIIQATAIHRPRNRISISKFIICRLDIGDYRKKCNLYKWIDSIRFSEFTEPTGSSAFAMNSRF